MMTDLHLPTLNATLNAGAFLFLSAGYFFVKTKRLTAHKWAMVGALSCSVLFLVSYVYYHFHSGSTRFLGEGWIRPVYFSILITHTILATAIAPMVLVTVFRAARGDFKRHAAIARWTWPLWIYVSITGVIVYWMLYQL